MRCSRGGADDLSYSMSDLLLSRFRGTLVDRNITVLPNRSELTPEQLPICQESRWCPAYLGLSSMTVPDKMCQAKMLAAVPTRPDCSLSFAVLWKSGIFLTF